MRTDCNWLSLGGGGSLSLSWSGERLQPIAVSITALFSFFVRSRSGTSPLIAPYIRKEFPLFGLGAGADS